MVFSADLEWVAPALIANADFQATIRPNPRCLENVIRRVAGRSARVRPADIASLDLADLAFAIQPGSAAACVRRLQRIVGGRSTGAAADGAPALDRLVGYGAAADQMRMIVADIERLRAGSLHARDLPSVLLHGAPGTGKTMLVRSLARTARLPLVMSSVSTWFENSDGFLGGVAKSAQRFFAEVAACAPAVAFLDELDALPDRARLDARGRDWWNPIVTGVLLHIDRTRALDAGVILIAATNHPSHLDEALKRPGRFDRHIEVTAPRSAGELAGVLRHHLGADLGDTDLAPFAWLGLGATGAIAEQWVKSAREAARGYGREVGAEDLRQAIAPPDDRSPEELLRCALHEAAHAIVGVSFGASIELVSLVQTTERSGVARFNATSAFTEAGFEERVVIALAGRAADELFGGGADSGAARDLHYATRLVIGAHAVLGLRQSLTSLGLMDDPDLILRTDPFLARRVEEDLQRLMEKTRILVAELEKPVRRLADLLMTNRVATPDDVDRLMSEIDPSSDEDRGPAGV
ncbi:MAG: AAA family ATPase [Ancylobacter novellus]|uniref:AAA family ATPase n=1 Tax=Ancylobacter novellus TaxID=921 RepID=A0A2W5MZR7_ANCNO|nr:MAG: AAA family ATPase [Ancylobacter novellus]